MALQLDTLPNDMKIEILNKLNFEEVINACYINQKMEIILYR